ncbi:SRPBCC domain-containing protein [Pedobacter sp. BMA]|uniref:SRPBCC family protein n=1 Tax=Pedobacter sp. BMA TaxID=1663685 RepID=UPI0006493C1C|nr:SRPBCC domain-containing protein [Pedobacter sp. BMA]KLT67015.1 ATPase [Pedobacter sp. BMA]
MSQTTTFTIDKNTLNVKRVFEAPVDTLWKAWTTAEILDQWWGPKPYRAETKSLDFSEGGTWFYAMVSPENEKHFSKSTFQQIDPEKAFTASDTFCDENGTPSNQFPGSRWKVSFTPQNEHTMIDINIVHENEADVKQILEMGFKEGFTIGLNQLEEYLEGNL